MRYKFQLPLYDEEIQGKDLQHVSFTESSDYRKLDWHSYYNEEIWLECSLAEDAELTDVIEASQIKANGFLVSERLKMEMEQLILPNHKFYKTHILTNTTIENYYYFQVVDPMWKSVDYNNVTFKVIEDITHESQIVQFNNSTEAASFRRKNMLSKFIPSLYKFIGNVEGDDIIYIGLYDPYFYLSEKFNRIINESGITGFKLSEAPYFREQ